MSIMSKTQKEKSGSGRIFLCAFIYNIHLWSRNLWKAKKWHSPQTNVSVLMHILLEKGKKRGIISFHNVSRAWYLKKKTETGRKKPGEILSSNIWRITGWKLMKIVKSIASMMNHMTSNLLEIPVSPWGGGAASFKIVQTAQFCIFLFALFTNIAETALKGLFF